MIAQKPGCQTGLNVFKIFNHQGQKVMVSVLHTRGKELVHHPVPDSPRTSSPVFQVQALHRRITLYASATIMTGSGSSTSLSCKWCITTYAAPSAISIPHKLLKVKDGYGGDVYKIMAGLIRSGGVNL